MHTVVSAIAISWLCLFGTRQNRCSPHRYSVSNLSQPPRSWPRWLTGRFARDPMLCHLRQEGTNSAYSIGRKTLPGVGVVASSGDRTACRALTSAYGPRGGIHPTDSVRLPRGSPGSRGHRNRCIEVALPTLGRRTMPIPGFTCHHAFHAAPWSDLMLLSERSADTRNV